MRLAHPFYLLLLLLIPLQVWLRHRRRQSRTIQFSSTRVLAELPRTWRIRLQPVLPLLFALGTACWIIALARPQRGLDDSRVRTEAVDIILLMDLSGSMDTRDFMHLNQRISRLDASKDVIARFLEKRPDDRIGMVAFASLPYAVAPLTLDHEWLVKRMEGLHTQMLDGRRTAIGDGIASAVNRLRDSEAKSKIIILLTDGENNWGTLSPENAAGAAEALGIRIYTIGAGGAGAAYLPQRDEIDAATLRRIAKTTGGQFYRARDLKTLDDVYTQIDQLEKTEIEVESFTRFEETSGGWIVAGIALLAAEQLLSLTRLGRLP